MTTIRGADDAPPEGRRQPAVSIVLPTFNRARLLRRAIESVRAQTFTDWELIVVDDGSTDDTTALLSSLNEPRLRVLTQPNRGAAAARNAGVQACTGRYLTFLDSDDEWLPPFLALTCGFLDRHPDEAWVATESWEVKADGRQLRQDLHALRGHYVDLARHIGSRALALPNGAQDDYLRVYDRCEPLDDWALPLVHGTGCNDHRVRWYRGHIGEHYRWGYFHALWCIVLRREALDGLSPFPVGQRSCNDLQFLIELALRHPSNLIALPAVRKHLVGGGTDEGQLTGARAYMTFTRNYADVIDRCFVQRLPHDDEVQRLYAFRRLEAGKAALAHGERAEARPHLSAAARRLRWPVVLGLRAMAWLAPTNRLAALAYACYDRIQYRLARH